MSGAKYRRVAVDLPEGVGAGLEDAVGVVNGFFDVDDFFVARDGKGLELWLREIDLNVLREAVAAAEVKCGEGAALSAIVQSVEGVGSFGIRGGKRLYVGYNRERKVVNRKGKELRRGKHFYANDHDFSRGEGRMPSEFVDRVVCGDSESVLKGLPDNCVDLVFTSPPYNFGLAYGEGGDGEGEDAADWECYFEKLFAVFDECIRVLKFGGRIVVNVQPLFSDYIPSHHIVSNFFMGRRLIWKGEILWEKNNYNCKYTAWGSWRSPSSPYLKYTWEFLEVFCKGDLRKVGAASDADIDGESFKEWVLARWSIAPERRMGEFGHPAMFPVELARRVLLLFSFRGDVVLDPFAGVGSACVAAQETGRRFLGVDVSREYCDAAEGRLVNKPFAF